MTAVNAVEEDYKITRVIGNEILYYGEITSDDIKEIIANRLKDWMVKRHKL